MLELLEAREACNSLYNPLFGSAFLALDDLTDVPYSVVPDDSGSSGGTGAGQNGSDGAGSNPIAWTDPGGADAAFAAATTVVDGNANQFDSVLNTDDTSFASLVAANINAQGQSGGTPGVGAAVVIGVPGPTTPPTSSTPSQGATSGPAPAVYPPAGTTGLIGQSLSPSEFGLNPFTLRGSGATVGALTPFVVSAGMTVPAAQSNGGTTVSTGTDANGIGYTTTTIDSYSFAASLAQDSTGGLTYDETYSFSYDVQTVPAATGGASVHDWGSSGYTFIANNDNGQYSFTLAAALTSCEVGSQTQTTTASDGSTNTTTTTWQSESQYDRTITNTTNQTTGAATGSDSGGGVATQSASTVGTYSRPITIGFGVGTVNGSESTYSGQGASYQFAIQDSRDAGGAITQDGTWADAGGGYSGDWYSGSGAYAVASGNGSASTPATADAAPAPSAWGGPYAPGVTLTGGGAYTESGADSMGYGSSDQYSLQNDGSWQASSGVASSSGTGWQQDSYSGSGGYNYAIDGGSVTGTWQQGGGDETNYQDATNATLSGDGWATTGTSSSGDAGGQSDSYSGSGSYAIASSSSGSTAPPAVSASAVPSASGGMNAPGAVFSGNGVVSETGSSDSGYADSTSSTLDPTGAWQPASGSSWSNASGSAQWSYFASGGYDYAIAGGSVSGEWQQSGSANTSNNTTATSSLSGGAWTSSGTTANSETGGQHIGYSGAGRYVIAASVGAATLSGGGSVTESATTDWGYGYATQAAMSSDGSWQAPSGSGGGTTTDSSQWAYSASGGYTRPLDGGTLSGTWQASGGASGGFLAQTTSTPNSSDGGWTSTGTASSSGSGSGAWSYSGSGAFSQSSSSGNAANGSQSAFSSQATEGYSESESSQYGAVSTLAADGSVTTVTTASASGGDSGAHTYSSSGSSSSWQQSGSGTQSGSSSSSGESLAESLQSQWQEGYTITAGPSGTTTTGGASGSGQASGAASWYSNANGYADSASRGSGSGSSSNSSSSWSSAASGQDNYNDQNSWSEPWNLVGASSSSGSSSGTTTDHVWGDASTTTSGNTTTTSYNQDVNYPGFYQGAFSGMAHDAGWAWGVAWLGGGANGPLGPSAFSGLGYAFTAGDPVAVTNPGDQFNTEGDSVSLQVQESDWSAGGSGGWTAAGLPNGLSINPASGLITGTVQAGDAANGPYTVAVTYIDAAGYADHQSFSWFVASPITITDPGSQAAVAGAPVSLQIQASDATGGTLTFGATDLPPGLGIDSQTGKITGPVSTGASGTYTAAITATDGTYSGSQTVTWNVAAAPAAAVSDQPTDGFFAALVNTGGNAAAFLAMPTVALMAGEQPEGKAPETKPIDFGQFLAGVYNPDPEAPLPIEPGAFLDLGYSLLSDAAADAAVKAGLNLSIQDAIKKDWSDTGGGAPSGAIANASKKQFGSFVVGGASALIQQLGLEGKLDADEKQVRKELEKNKYGSIDFNVEGIMSYRITNMKSDGITHHTPRVTWSFRLVLTTTATKGTQRYVSIKTLGSVDSSYNADDAYKAEGTSQNYLDSAVPPRR